MDLVQLRVPPHLTLTPLPLPPAPLQALQAATADAQRVRVFSCSSLHVPLS
jgi:hypothetical protein